MTEYKNFNLDINIEKLLDIIKQFDENIYKTTNIFLGNPFDLIEMDFSEIPSNCWFISHYSIEKGKIFKVEDEDLKRMLYNFIENHPDRIFKGQK